jgi:hypothetical protein
MRKTTQLLRALPVAVVAVLPLAAAAPPKSPPAKPAAAKPAATAQLVVAPDIERRLSRFKPVEMPFSTARFSAREKKLLETLIAASRDLENLYWRQSDPDSLALYKSLAGATSPRDRALRRMLWINGSRYDLVDENRPFVGTAPMPPGRALYPQGVTRQQLDAYVAAHPAEKQALYDEHTVVRRKGNGYEAVPYRVAFRRFLEPAAQKLRAAAALSDEPGFAKFLRLRADALLSDDYYASDLAWLDLENPKFDVIFAPYETYLDDLLGVKTSYGAAVMVRNEVESAKLAVFQKYVPDLQDALPLPAADRPSKHGRVASMEVMDTPFRAGDLRHGYQAAADNLPNDPRVHQEKGSKRIFFKNFMDARVDEVILPVAKRLMRADQAAKASAEGYLTAVLMHEICHGLGPAYARVGGKEVDIRQAIGASYSGLEEAKADATGMFGLAWMMERGALPKARREEYYASFVAGIFRTVRFGVGEAHGKAEMMAFNYLSEQRAIVRDPASGLYGVDFAKIPGAFAKLAQELLTIEATGDRARSEAWFARYDKMPAELRASLEKAKDLPVDFDPRGPFAEGVE